MNDELFRPPRTFAGIPVQSAPFDEARVAVLPVPYDSTTEYKAGTREGPQAIIDSSQYLELYDPELNCEISDVGIYTLPEVQPLASNPESMVERVSQITRDLLEKGKLPVILGGEHSITVGAIKAFHEKCPSVSVLHLDAHADLRDQYMGTKFSHACVMHRVWEICPFVQAGIRSLSKDEREFIKQNEIKSFSVEDLTDPNFNNQLIANLSSQVYISIDVDVLDPSIMSAVGTPEPGGLNWQQILGILRTIASNKQIVGFDIVELCPSEGPTACSFLAAKLAYKLIGYATSL